MGMPMCARLIRAGFAVTAFDIRAGLRPAVQRLGAEWAASTGSAGADADVLITMLPGPAEVCGVIAEIMRSLPVGATWIDRLPPLPRVAACDRSKHPSAAAQARLETGS
jgi:3-hydroxyisobutyrate dehydrogenase